MWKSRVLCEISKVRWKSFCDFHGPAISSAADARIAPQRSDQRDGDRPGWPRSDDRRTGRRGLSPRFAAWSASSESSRPFLGLVRHPRFEPRAIGLAVDDEVIGVAGEAIDRALRAHGIGEGGEPFIG